MARVTAVFLAVACVLAAAASASIYPGKSQALMPTLKEIGFTQLVTFQPTKKPAAALAKGYKNGVVALYQKGTQKVPIQSVATVYVYSSTANARLAWNHACAKCKTQAAPAGLRLKAQAGTSAGMPVIHEVTVCANVYLDVVVQGKESALKLDTDAAKITNAVLTRATHTGLSSCSAK